jgi:hypothetical protein
MTKLRRGFAWLTVAILVVTLVTTLVFEGTT